MEPGVFKFPVMTRGINFNIKWNYEPDGTMKVSAPGKCMVFTGFPLNDEAQQFQLHLNCFLQVQFTPSMEILERLDLHRLTRTCNFEPIEVWVDNREISTRIIKKRKYHKRY